MACIFLDMLRLAIFIINIFYVSVCVSLYIYIERESVYSLNFIFLIYIYIYIYNLASLENTFWLHHHVGASS